MTDIKLLTDVIRAKGLKLSYIAEKIGLSRQGLYTRLKGKTEFKQTEITTLCDVLSLNRADKERIFFSKKCE